MRLRVYDSLQPLLRCCISLALLCLMATGACAADRPTKPMRETATLPADMNVLKRFGPIEEYLAEKRWAEAIDVLQEIAQTDGRMLVLAKPGITGESAVYLNVATRCNILLAQLPPEGLAAYRKKVDPQAKRWMDHWKQTHDEADLQRVVREAYLSSYGDEALWALGESAWDRGDTASARLYWTQLQPLGPAARAANLPTVLQYPDSDVNPAEVLARLVLCTVMEDDRNRAAAELDRLQELFPDAEGTLAGRRGKLVDLLKQILDESAQWELPTEFNNVATFGLNAGRCGALPATVDIGASKWSHPLPADRLPHLDRFNATSDPPLSFHPVTFGDIVLVNNARSIWAWNLLTGEPAWGTAEIYSPVAGEVASRPHQMCSGVPYFTMTVADGRLYARMGSAVTNPVEKDFNASQDSDLVCLDLAGGQGKLAWKVAAQELIKEDHTPWRFEGSPLVVAGRAYVALSRRRPQIEFAIACLDAATGTLLWNRPIVSARGAVEDHQNRVSHLLLTAGAGKLYLSTDAGAIVAVNAKDGRLDWAVTYESDVPTRPSSHLHQGLLPAIFHEGFVFVVPNDCNRLFCIEADSGRVRWQRRQPDAERWRHLLGVVPGGDAGRLIVSGNTLWSIDIHTGNMVFGSRPNGPGNRPPLAEQGYGRGVLADKVILWPTREAIKIVDAATGTAIGHKPLQTPGGAEVGGNLTVSQGMLLVAQPERLVAYCEYSLLKQRLERELSDRTSSGQSSSERTSSERGGVSPPAGNSPKPGNSRPPLQKPRNSPFASPVDPGRRTRQMSTESLLGQLSDVELAQGNLDAALSTLRQAIEASDGHEQADKSTSSRHRIRLLELLRQAGRAAMAEGDAKLAVERFVEARQLATQPADVVAILLDLADAELARDRPVAAIEYWQHILDDNSLRDATYRVTTAGATAAAAISRLIGKRGRAVYAEVERRAKSEIASLLRREDLDGLRWTLQTFPNAEATGRAWRQLALMDRRAGQFHSALAIYACQLAQPATGDVPPEALVDWADTLEAAGYWRSARTAWKQLASDKFSRAEIQRDGLMHRVGELAHQRLANAAFRVYEPSEDAAVRVLDRAWSINLASRKLSNEGQAGNATGLDGATILVPRNESPAAALACLLVHRPESKADGSETRWDCVNRVTGRVRWSRSLTADPQWCAYADSHLLLATDSQLIALELETGRELWSTGLTTSVEPSGHRRVIADGLVWNLAENNNRPAMSEAPIQLCVRDHWVLAFDGRTGVVAIDARTGSVAWTFMPPRGKLQRQWTCGTRQIALQTLKPAITWSIDISTERRVTERPGPAEPWLQGPFVDDQEAMVMVNADHRIESRSTATGRNQWRYQGGMSFAHVDPVLWPAGSQLLLTVDGTTLASVNRLTGLPDWSVGIADRPLKVPAGQVIAHDQAAFAASHGLLRRISLEYGVCQWEQFLGSTADQWRVVACKDSIAAWPVELGSATASPSPSPQFIVWCDARTGRILQRMNLAKGERVIDVTNDEHGCLVQTDRSLVAFQTNSEQRDVVSTGR